MKMMKKRTIAAALIAFSSNAALADDNAIFVDTCVHILTLGEEQFLRPSLYQIKNYDPKAQSLEVACAVEKFEEAGKPPLQFLASNPTGAYLQRNNYKYEQRKTREGRPLKDYPALVFGSRG